MASLGFGVLRALAVALPLLAVAAALVVAVGLYEVAADRGHWQPVHTLLETTLRQSVRLRALALDEDALAAVADDPAVRRRGAACYAVHCAACHGAPGVAPQPAALAMQPLPGPLLDAGRTWRLRELVWLTRHGVRMSGMPAWRGLMAERDIDAVAVFVARSLPQTAPAAWQALAPALAAEGCARPAPDAAVPAPDAVRTIHRHGCAGCHVIPGVVGSARHVGPPLAGYGRRTHLRGREPLTEAALAAWLRDPQAGDPGSAMPPTGLDEVEARAVARYLLSLR
jgi:mono/diheme cytochrome c family protein